MEKIRNYMKKPITWGEFGELYLISLAAGLLVGLVEVAVWFPDYIPETLNELKKKLPWNRNK